MSIASTIAVSGFSVASLRLQVAASNIAKASSDGPLPGTPNPEFPSGLFGHAGQSGGIRRNQRDRDQCFTAHYRNIRPDRALRRRPRHGGKPNVDLANELVQVLVARFGYAANAQVIRVDAQMSAALFNITV